MSEPRPYREARRLRLLELLDEAGGPGALMARTGVTDTHLTACSKGRRNIGDDMAESLERGMGKPTGWMDSHPRESGTFPAGQSQNVRLDAATMLPTIAWETLMNQKLPAVFRVSVPDDSMAPRVRVGQFVTVTTTEDPRPGDGVLVADGDGNVYLRLYQAKRPGHWLAAPLNEAFTVLDSREDSLQVLGVLVGVEARWG